MRGGCRGGVAALSDRMGSGDREVRSDTEGGPVHDLPQGGSAVPEIPRPQVRLTLGWRDGEEGRARVEICVVWLRAQLEFGARKVLH